MENGKGGKIKRGYAELSLSLRDSCFGFTFGINWSGRFGGKDEKSASDNGGKRVLGKESTG